MFCGNCGKEMENGSTFCPFCGECSAEENTPSRSKDAADKYQKLFVDAREQYIASLGDSYLNSYLSSKKIEHCIAVLSSKKLYLYGTMYDSDNVLVSRKRIEKVVNIEDITGTGFVYQEPSLWKLVLGIILLFPIVTAIIAIPLMVSYLKERQSLFAIDYAGGHIKFDVSIYGIAESQDFHKMIRRVQDSIKDKNK
ncbi:zinc ribbon domain-containing protein [bacterium D16-50]|nr:zinc ribbon domain-containing protein [bacterium D16-50]